MRAVVRNQLLSVDGVAAEPGDWVFDVDKGVFAHVGRVIEHQDDVLLGRGLRGTRGRPRAGGRR